MVNYKQTKASDYLDNAEILKALNIKAEAGKAQDSAPAVSTRNVLLLFKQKKEGMAEITFNTLYQLLVIVEVTYYG